MQHCLRKDEVYLVEQLKAFRNGSRQNPWMSPQTKQLSNADIADLAAYYSNLQ
jgi:cytochrome c553